MGFLAMCFLASVGKVVLRVRLIYLRNIFLLLFLSFSRSPTRVLIFSSEVVEALAIAMDAKHRFSTAFVSWSMGTVETMCSKVLRIMHVVSTEPDVPKADWTETLPAIQSLISKSPFRRLGGRAPTTAHTVMSPENPFLAASSLLKNTDVGNFDQMSVLQRLEVDRLLMRLDEMHRTANE